MCKNIYFVITIVIHVHTTYLSLSCELIIVTIVLTILAGALSPIIRDCIIFYHKHNTNYIYYSYKCLSTIQVETREVILIYFYWVLISKGPLLEIQLVLHDLLYDQANSSHGIGGCGLKWLKSVRSLHNFFDDILLSNLLFFAQQIPFLALFHHLNYSTRHL